MKERPIIFSGKMVRALLDGRKTQTRLVVKPQPEYCLVEWVGNMLGFKKRYGDGFWLWPNAKDQIVSEYCKFSPGDRLWVRENWQSHLGPYAESIIYAYKATDDERLGPWKPSIYMPRCASRITLEVTDVRLERLQNISEADAQAEGFSYSSIPLEQYRWVWEIANGLGSWDANPWVWVIEFKRIEKETK
jgi:hypothetical protein